MEIQELEKSKIESFTALSNLNIEISEARNRLTKLQEEETAYLEEREKKALEKIDKAVNAPQIVYVEKIVEVPSSKPLKDVGSIISAEQMESMQALADISVKISEAKNLLFELQEQETEYLKNREKKAGDRIQQIVDESREMVKEADNNHSKIKVLSSGLSGFVGNLVKAQEDLHSLFEDFEERNVEWEKDIGRQQDDIAEIRKQQKIREVELINTEKSLSLARKKLGDDQKKLNSDRGTLERAIQRLREKRI